MKCLVGCSDREVGTASSWSLSRLDSLAEEVKSCFMAQHTSLPALPPAPSSNPHTHPSNTQRSDSTQTSTRNRNPAPDTNSAAGGRFVASRLVTLLRSLLGSSPAIPPSEVSDATTLADRQSSHSNASTSGSPMNKSSTSQARDADKQPAVPETGQHHTSGQSPVADRPVAKAMREYPMQTFAAINTVLFERHGYQRMQIHGDPRYIWQCAVRTVRIQTCLIIHWSVTIKLQVAKLPSCVIHSCDSFILLSYGTVCW